MEVSSVLSAEFISALCICILRYFSIRKTFVYYYYISYYSHIEFTLEKKWWKYIKIYKVVISDPQHTECSNLTEAR